MEILKVDTEKRRIGNVGEKMAARYLFFHGYRILEKNLVIDGREIDIVARRGDTLAFIEVKTRSVDKLDPHEARPASSVTPEKQRKIITAAAQYKGMNYSRCEGLRIRFDVIEVLLEKKNNRYKRRAINHLTAAFDKDTAYRRPWDK